MGSFDLIKKWLSFGAIDSHDGRQSKITNEVLLKELVAHFKEQMKELSVRTRLLYPMSFNILMHPDDYNATKEAFPFILPEVVAEFYLAIKRERKRFNNKVNSAPPATYWFFQFSACQINGQDGNEDFIKRGEIVTTGSLTTFDISKAQQGNSHKEANVRLSVKCQNSHTNDNNINMDALLGMEILSEGAYTFQFDNSLNDDTTVIAAAAGVRSRGWATLRWAADDGNTNVYEMFDNYIDISGKDENRKQNNIVKIDNDAVSISHVQIKYDPQTRSFMLAAFAKTRLNGREVPISPGRVPQWIVLPKYNSKIFLNDAVNVEFNANVD